jgi:hypothetical protein
MSDNRTLILAEFEKLKGQHVLHTTEVMRLLAIGEDDTDFYYVLWDGRSDKKTWATCLCKLVPLKGFLRDEDYNELVRLATLNHADQTTAWNYDPKARERIEMLYDKSDRYLTEICWELN